MRVCAIASGSNGNCYYIDNKDDAVLIDAGINCKQILLRLEKKGLSIDKIRAVFITHEHGDHVKGARVFSKKTGIPIYLTKRTFNSLKPNAIPPKFKLFNIGDTCSVNDLNIHSFSKKHDAIEPCSFRIESDGISVGVMTDIGEACDNVTTNIAQCTAIFMEANYDDIMLKNGGYPYYLKQRIMSDHGHLSNKMSSELIEKHASDKLKYIFLSHLSGENNTPAIAIDEFKNLNKKCYVDVMSRNEPSSIIDISK